MHDVFAVLISALKNIKQINVLKTRLLSNLACFKSLRQRRFFSFNCFLEHRKNKSQLRTHTMLIFSRLFITLYYKNLFNIKK